MHQNSQTFNLSDVAAILSKKKNFIVTFVLLSVLIAAALVFFVLPRQYKSTAVVVATNPVLADKARLFNDNIEGLYSTYGSEDDLNRIYGIATLDTTYKQLVQKFDLIQYYEIEGDDAPLNQRKAIVALKEDLDLTKTELYQLKISATTKDKMLSASLANALVDIVQSMMQDVWKNNTTSTLQNIQSSTVQLEKQIDGLKDSVSEVVNIKRSGLLKQIQQNQKLINQYSVTLSNNMPALIVLEKAYPSAKADKPQKLFILSAAFFAALAFSIMIVLLFERRG